MPKTPDQLTIDTPEQVAIRFSVAGVGSRFLAILADTLVQGMAYVVLVLIYVLIIASGNAVDATPAKWLIAVMIGVHFLLYWGYFTIFEAYWNGQTPGKRLCKLRVIRDSGRQITFFESMTRNLLRAVDGLPGFYAVGVVAMLFNRRNKRLGDLAAGTLVVHERTSEISHWSGAGTRTITPVLVPDAAPVASQPFHPSGVDLPADAVSRLTSDHLHVIDQFLARAIDLDPARRRQLAEQLAQQLTGKMGIPMPGGAPPERILESIAYILRSIRR